jgi:glycerophosphoryl diester phosphodiesterase
MKTLIWGHRGAASCAPENTLESFALAADQGADGIELDIQLTRDGQIVVCHDETLERVSNGSGNLKDHTLAELKALEFNKTHPEYAHARIPTLREVYQLVKPTGLMVNVELKTGIFHYEGMVDGALELTAAEGMEDRVIYSSFNHHTLVELKKKNPSVKTGLLYSDEAIGVHAYAKKVVGADALHPALYHMQDMEYVKKAHALGLATRVWTVDEELYIKLLLQMGVEGIITNRPALARYLADQAAARPGLLRDSVTVTGKIDDLSVR